MQTKRAKNELSGLDYMSWKVEHELNCMMNNTGNSSVRMYISYNLFFFNLNFINESFFFFFSITNEIHKNVK